MSIEPSPFLPQTTIAMEKVKIAARAAQAISKSIFIFYLIILYINNFNKVNYIKNLTE